MKGGYSQDYYRLLGVADDADTATIKRAYRQHIARHHPDRQANSDEDVVHQLNTAYAILKMIKYAVSTTGNCHAFAKSSGYGSSVPNFMRSSRGLVMLPIQLW